MKSMRNCKFYIAAIASGIFIFFGCTKVLDITPDGRITINEVFNDELLASAYLNTVYGDMQHYGTAYDYWTMLEGKTDNSHDNDNPGDQGRSGSRWYNGELRPNWNPLDIQAITGANPATNGLYYPKSWKAIRETNIFLNNIDKTTFTNPDVKARLIAEAKTLRAFFYLELIKMYGGMPIVDKPFTEDFKFEELPRNTFAECADFIAKDCADAIAEPKFPWRIATEPERGRLTKAVAYAIRSEALLYAASPLWNPTGDNTRWTKAADGSLDAITDLGGAGYQLFPDYEKYFIGRSDLSSSPSDRETIYEIKTYSTFDFSGLMFQEQAIVSLLGGEKTGCSPSQELVDAYEMADGSVPITGYQDEDHLIPIINPASGYDDQNPYVNRDPRFYATVWYNNAYYGKIGGNDIYIESYLGGRDGISDIMQRSGNGYYLRKYKDPNQLTIESGSSLYKRFRFTEMYLNYAEAANEANGPTPEVYNAINKIRSRAGMPDLPAGLSKDDMRKRIHNERRVEMAFEETRFYDVRRWKIIGQTDRLTTGMQWTMTGPNQFTGERIVVDRRKTYTDNYLIIPIPEKEINIMKAWQQNPGW